MAIRVTVVDLRHGQPAQTGVAAAHGNAIFNGAAALALQWKDKVVHVQIIIADIGEQVKDNFKKTKKILAAQFQSIIA